MKKRVLALVCCLSLTLGLFTYRPPEAKAIVTEASLATSVLWSFMQSAGITFNGTGMNSSSWAEAIEPYLRDFTEWKDSAAKSFWHWLGYDGASEFIKALSWSKITHPTTMPFPSVVIPPAAAKKMGEFTHWFVEKVGLISGGESKPVVSAKFPKFYKMKFDSKLGYLCDSEIPCTFSSYIGPKNYSLGTPVFNLYDLPKTRDDSAIFGFSDRYWFWMYLDGDEGFYSKNWNWSYDWHYTSFSKHDVVDGNVFIFPYTNGNIRYACGYEIWENVGGDKVKRLQLFDDSCLPDSSDIVVNQISASQSGVLSPTYDDKGEKPTVVAYPNINGDLSSINDLLQQILDKLAANDLNSSASLEGEAAPDVPATDIGWKGTIEKIYQGIIDLPGRIADAFKALLEGLFAPDAALMQEMTDTFKGKFSFLTTLHKVGTDLFCMTAETDPPVIWVHLEDAEGKYTYGGPVKALDLSWYQRYKADVDKLISGFLWLAFLWLLFKRAASIIHGGEMYTEYASDIRDYYRSGKKDDGPTVPINRRLGE